MNVVLRIIIGTFAILYVVGQIFTMLVNLGTTDTSSPFVWGLIGGHIAGICIGLAVAVLCFRRFLQSRF